MKTNQYDAEAVKRLDAAIHRIRNGDYRDIKESKPVIIAKDDLETVTEAAAALRAAHEYIEGLKKAVNRALELNKRPINDMALNEQQRILSEAIADQPDAAPNADTKTTIPEKGHYPEDWCKGT